MSTTQLKKWTVTGGPRKTKPAQKAIKKLLWLKDSKRELNGVKGGKESSCVVQVLFLGAGENDFPEFFRTWDQLGEPFEWVITNANCKEVEEACAVAYTELHKILPVEDNRRTPEEDAEGKALVAKHDAERKVAQDENDAIMAQVTALAPAGAKRAVIAAYYVDKCDSMSDYFHAECTRNVVIGFGRTAREDLRLCKQLAGNFPETADLAAADKSEVEKRPGCGYPSKYVGFANSYDDGWKVYSQTLPLSHVSRLEIAAHLLNPPSKPDIHTEVLAAAERDRAGSTNTADYEITEIFHTKKNCDVFLAIPKTRLDRDTFIRERQRCTDAGGWYSRQWKESPGGFAFETKAECEAFAKG